MKSDAKFEEKLTLGSKYDMRNFVNINASSVLLLLKVYYVWAIKEQRIYVS